jgi:uncharacterized protein (TIGR01244 family)
MFRTLDEHVSVWGQIAPEELAAVRAAGFATLVNNRPDGEQPGQPSGDEIAAAARAAGLSYHAIPVDHSGFAEWQVAAMADALSGTEGPVLAFCRSGTRSTFLWALARARLGDPADTLVAKAAAAGYDIEPLRPALHT